MIVYLSGGMHSGWQDEARELMAKIGVKFLDPRVPGLEDAKEYTTWDIIAIRACDIVLAYADPGSPSYIGMAAEIGFAKGLNKMVLLVRPPDVTDKYLDFVAELADMDYGTIEGATDFLRTLLMIERP